MEGSIMGQVRHGCATTTHAIRAAIQRSQATTAALSRELGINVKTVEKWRKVVEVEIHSIFPTIANWRDKTLEHRVHTVSTHDTETTRDQNLNEKKN